MLWGSFSWEVADTVQGDALASPNVISLGKQNALPEEVLTSQRGFLKRHLTKHFENRPQVKPSP